MKSKVSCIKWDILGLSCIQGNFCALVVLKAISESSLLNHQVIGDGTSSMHHDDVSSGEFESPWIQEYQDLLERVIGNNQKEWSNTNSTDIGMSVP
jgi:hypothetical protein